MSVDEEARALLHQDGFPPIDEYEHEEHEAQDTTHRYTDSDVAEHLGSFSTEAELFAEQQADGDAAHVHGIDLTGADSPGRHSGTAGAGEGSRVVDLTGADEASTAAHATPKPNRDVHKQNDGKYHCPLPDCKEPVRAFVLRSAWNKHMDKHERPYRCPAAKCENNPGFTYSGGLLRHEREVHRKHGGPRVKVHCPHPNCKRHSGKGFSRQENLTEHLRRVHMNKAGPTPPPRADSPAEDSSDASSLARKRRLSDASLDGTDEMRVEIKRLRVENKSLRAQLARLQATPQLQSDGALDFSSPVQVSEPSSQQECLGHGELHADAGASCQQDRAGEDAVFDCPKHPDHEDQVPAHHSHDDCAHLALDDQDESHPQLCSPQPDSLHHDMLAHEAPMDMQHDDLHPIVNLQLDMQSDAMLEERLDPDALIAAHDPDAAPSSPTQMI
ncbi:hypothetical protein CDD81_5236 [Ophiocordyceps australis]|uniref:C2H2-type domain-containing protein n=1 Tax=Ophiocordyceps australis TaxID=1399860 RepID=A0A2C5YIS5_9HYPO|nr:hypothetical protein CDD81_5236 [Ophiocordyceps australis]